MPDPGTIVGNILGSPEFTALLLTAITAIVGWVVATAGWAWRKYILGKLSADELATLERIATIAVTAAEQMGLGKTGEEKLALALDFASRQLAVYGINVTPEQLRAAIEAAVYTNLGWHAPYSTIPAPAPDETPAS